MNKLLIERLETRLAERKRSARDVSIAATGQTDTVRNILRGATRNPRAETLERIAEELDTTAAYLLGRTDDATRGALASVRPAPVAPPSRNGMPNDVPVHGTAAASHLRGAFQLDAGVIDYVRRPPALAGARDAYALYVEGSSMQPRYEQGDLVFVHPHRPVRPGDAVVVQVAVGPDEIEASIGFYRRQNADHLVIGKLNPEAEVRLNRNQITAVHRVLTMNELFGV